MCFGIPPGCEGGRNGARKGAAAGIKCAWRGRRRRRMVVTRSAYRCGGRGVRGCVCAVDEAPRSGRNGGHAGRTETPNPTFSQPARMSNNVAKKCRALTKHLTRVRKNQAECGERPASGNMRPAGAARAARSVRWQRGVSNAAPRQRNIAWQRVPGCAKPQRQAECGRQDRRDLRGALSRRNNVHSRTAEGGECC